MNRQTLQQIVAEHDGKVSDKWSAYINGYERIFSEFRNENICLLEIGIQNGGSLEIWEKYFPKVQAMVGCDINPSISALEYTNPCINLVIGDANQDATAKQILAYCDSFNIIIDDGSHRSDEIITAFARFFPALSEGGAYIVEDLHCSYWEEYRGGLNEPFSSIAFFKRLADIINFEHWGVIKKRVEFLEQFSREYGCHFDESDLQMIHSIEFTNSMCIIRKMNPVANRLGTRIFSGKVESVTNSAEEYAGKELITPDQSDNYWSFQAIAIEDELKNRLEEIDELKKRLEEVEVLKKRIEEIAVLNEKNALLEEQLKALQQESAEMEASVSWKITKPLRIFKSQNKR